MSPLTPEQKAKTEENVEASVKKTTKALTYTVCTGKGYYIIRMDDGLQGAGR